MNALWVNQIGYVKKCHSSMSKSKMLIHAQLNKMEFCPKFTELDRLCPIELMPISQIMPFITLID